MQYSELTFDLENRQKLNKFAIANVGNEGSNPTVTFKMRGSRFAGLLLYTINNQSAISAARVDIVAAGNEGDVDNKRLYPDGNSVSFSIARGAETIDLTVGLLNQWSTVVFLCTANITETTINYER